jgi:hypothetical protein
MQRGALGRIAILKKSQPVLALRASLAERAFLNSSRKKS